MVVRGSGLFLVALLLGCASKPEVKPDPKVDNLEPLPKNSNPNRVTLGRMLFHDKRLSRNREIACSSCHQLTKFGIDGQSRSPGVGGRLGTRNTPTVFNAATHVAQFWDGRAATVEEQVAGPLLNPIEMAMPSEQAIVDVLTRVPRYADLFRKAFPDDHAPISLKNVGEAIGAFERGLVTSSRWDKFVSGDREALTVAEKRGLAVFMKTGCIACHQGPQLGGMTFQKVGAVFPWPNQKDAGRAAITKVPADRMMFKVPSLSNIAHTAPYFHDGSTARLEDAIRLMAHHQLGLELPAEDIESIAAWMQSMTGEIDPSYVAVPALPPGA